MLSMPASEASEPRKGMNIKESINVKTTVLGSQRLGLIKRASADTTE